MSNDGKPVTRIACFRFKPDVSPEQKGDRTKAFLGLYAQSKDLILSMPEGGKPLNTPLNLTNVKRESQWDTGFIVTFKNEEARQEFDKDSSHDTLKVLSHAGELVETSLSLTAEQEETDPLLEQVFVYDFVKEENLGW